MTISINTSDYIETKEIKIDGKVLRIRPMSSAETLALSGLGEEIKEMKNDPDEARKMMERLGEMYFSLYNEPETARKLLAPLPYNAWFEIYNKVFGASEDA